MSMPHDSHLPDAILFDMDGTLIDSEHLWLEAEIGVMRELGADWTAADQGYCVGGPLERVADYMVQRSGTDRSAQQVGALLLTRVETQFRESPLTWRPGAAEFLRECIDLGLPRALVTASWSMLVDAVADRMSRDIGGDPFTVVVAGDQLTRGKPHPEPYEHAARVIGASPARCLAIEDSPTGVLSAVSAGCVVVAVPHIAPITMDGVHVISGLEGRGVRELWSAATAGV